jgi:hypothetical protein
MAVSYYQPGHQENVLLYWGIYIIFYFHPSKFSLYLIFLPSSAVLSFLFSFASLFCPNCHSFRYQQYILNTDRISFQLLRILLDFASDPAFNHKFLFT